MKTRLPAPVTRLVAALRDCRGSSALEFAFVAPTLVFLTVGVMDVGRVVWMSSTLETVAADSARFAMLNGADSGSPATVADIAAFAESRATGIPAGELNVDVQWNPNNNPGGSVRVQLTHNFDSLLTGFINFGPFELKGIASRIVN